jgi:hypothetical protein
VGGVLECRGVDHRDAAFSRGNHRHLRKPLPVRTVSILVSKDLWGTYDIVAYSQPDLAERGLERGELRSTRECLALFECLFAGDINVEEVDFPVFRYEVACGAGESGLHVAHEGKKSVPCGLYTVHVL